MLDRYLKALWSEIKSWAGWLSRYKLPVWLSAPFQFGLFKVLYGIILGALGLVFLLPGLLA